MNEEHINKMLMIAGAILATLAGIGAVALLIMWAMDPDEALLFGTVLMAGAAVGFGWATTFFGQKVTGHPLIFTNEAEREVLTQKQRRELRRRRGEVVMERALIEVEQEKDNITHRAIEAANDDNRPPHQTQWTTNPQNLTDKRRSKGLKAGDYDPDDGPTPLHWP